MNNIEGRRSLIFNYSSKDLNDLVNANFEKYNNVTAGEILDNLLRYKISSNNKSTYDPNQIEEIILEDHDIQSMQDDLRNKIQECEHLESLGLNRCNLFNVRNLPYIFKLQRFQAEGNRLKVLLIINKMKKLRHLEQIIERYPELLSLSLINNEINCSQTKEIAEFISKTHIMQLNLSENPNLTIQTYEDLFSRCPNLLVIDNMERRGELVYYDADEQEMNLELGRNDGEDIKTLVKLLRSGGEAILRWSTDIKGKKLFDIEKKESEIKSQLERNQGKRTRIVGKQVGFTKEMEDDDEDDEEFNPQIDDDDDHSIRNTNSEMEEEPEEDQ